MTTLRCRVCDRECKLVGNMVTVWCLGKLVTAWCHGKPMVVQRVTTAKTVT